MAQLRWVLDDIDAVDADFRQRYRWPPDCGPGIADGHFPPTMSAARFFSLCELLLLQKDTVVRGMAEAEHAQTQQHDASHTPAAQRTTDSGEPQVVPDRLAPVHAGFAGDGGAFPPVFNVRTSSGMHQ